MSADPRSAEGHGGHCAVSSGEQKLSYRLSPAVAWNFVPDKGALQVRFPDGDHLTIDSDAEAVSDVLGALADGVEPGDADGDMVAEVTALLMERKVLVANRGPSDDWLESILEYVLAASSRRTGPSALVEKARGHSFSIRGQGWLAGVVADACRLAGLPIADGTDGDCIVAVADRIAHDQFSAVNRDACEAGTPVVFFWREVSRIICGPLVLPGQSACFECYRTRVRANIRFGAEFDALAALPPDGRDHLGSALAEGAARAFVARQLFAVAAEAYDLFEPNALYSYDALMLKLDRQALLRVPRCKTCGVLREEPVRAIRTLA